MAGRVGGIGVGMCVDVERYVHSNIEVWYPREHGTSVELRKDNGQL